MSKKERLTELKVERVDFRSAQVRVGKIVSLVFVTLKQKGASKDSDLSLDHKVLIPGSPYPLVRETPDDRRRARTAARAAINGERRKKKKRR